MTIGDMERMVLVDAYAAIYRGFYAIRGLTNPAGEPVNALYAIAMFTLRLERELPNTHGAAVFDKGRPAHRTEAIPEYKANRAPMPDELRCQIEPIRQWFELLGWPLLQHEGWEADDLIAMAVAERGGLPVSIVSHDKDLAQLVGPDVAMVLAGKRGEWRKLDPAGVEEKFGVPPDAIPAYLALVGDSSDNIPGVAGVGPKTAAKLLARFGSLGAMLERCNEVERPALREKLTAARGLLERNLSAVKLGDAPPPADWGGRQALRRRPPKWAALTRVAEENGFKTVLKGLRDLQTEYQNLSLL